MRGSCDPSPGFCRYWWGLSLNMVRQQPIYKTLGQWFYIDTYMDWNVTTDRPNSTIPKFSRITTRLAELCRCVIFAAWGEEKKNQEKEKMFFFLVLSVWSTSSQLLWEGRAWGNIEEKQWIRRTYGNDSRSCLRPLKPAFQSRGYREIGGYIRGRRRQLECL